MVDYVVGDEGVRDGDDLRPTEDEGQSETPEATDAPESTAGYGPGETAPKKESSPGKRNYPLLGKYAPHILFGLLAMAYLMNSIAAISIDYIDFGDGNYLYLSWRVAEGERLYSDLPSPQPPLHLLLGALLVKLGGGTLLLVRVWQAVQRILIACLVWTVGEELGKNKSVGGLAASLYLLLPEGFWWALGYQSEGLEILLLTFGVVAYLRGVRGSAWSPWMVLCGFSACLALYTNMTALVYVGVQIVALAYTHRRHLLRGYFAGLVWPCLLMFLFFFLWSDGEYIRHVWSRQVGTFPGGTLVEKLGYCLAKLLVEGGDIAAYQGGLVAIAAAGMILTAGMPSSKAHPERMYLLWWAMSGIGSIIFVIKGGTVEYIFTLGEPAVAVFAGLFLYTLFLGSDTFVPVRSRGPSRFLVSTRWLLVFAVLAPILFWRAGQLIAASAVRSMSVIECPEAGVKTIVKVIQDRANPDDPVLVPAHYAFVAQRPMAQHLSSTLILTSAYYEEFGQFLQEIDPALRRRLASLSTEPDPARHIDSQTPGYTRSAIDALAEYFKLQPRVRKRYPAIARFLDLREQLTRRLIPVVILNIKHMVSSVPLLQEPLRNHYQPIDLDTYLAPNKAILSYPAPWLGRIDYLTLDDRYNREWNVVETREERLRFYEPKIRVRSDGRIER